MKKIYFLFVISLITIGAYAQPWQKNLPQTKKTNKLTFFDYQKAFNDYWEPFNVNNKGYYIENGVKKKATGWKQFKRWEWDMEGQINPQTGEFPTKTAQQVYEEYRKVNPKLKSFKSANWVSLGPNSSAGGYAGVGRINCIAFHPSDTDTYWIGAPSGGLWLTINNGSSWTCLTDNNKVLGISDIVIPSDFATSNTIYIATGDRDGWDNRSVGVLKSTDAGNIWNNTGLSFNLSDDDMVTRLLLDPNNDNTIVAATTNGVYKTTDGGTTWSTQLTSTYFIDMEYKPGDFNTLYGSTKYGDIYVSSDGGSLWSQTFDTGNRIELAVSPDNPNLVYAVVVASDNGLYGVYKSGNSGSIFTQIFDGSTKNLLCYDSDGSGEGGQGFYDLSIAVSPSNANTVFVGGINTWRSTDGGSAWSIVNHWWGDGVPAVHADKHMLKYRNNGDLFECNDGGIYISTNEGTSWTDITNGMVLSQMYRLGVSQTVADEVITGLQDNGSKLLSGGIWNDVRGGDGMECLIDYTDIKTQYATYVCGLIKRTTNHWISSTDIEPTEDGAWVTPYIIDPTDHNTLYAGYANVWKTTNKGDSWTEISSMNSLDKLRSMAIAPSNTSVLYVADNKRIWKTTDGGSNWTKITNSLPVYSAYIEYVTVKNDDKNTIWVTLGGYNQYAVFETTDGGSNWTNISAGLPEIPAYSIVQNKQSTNELHLYVGTELGVYFKKGTDNWIEYNSGLPNVKIGELEIYYDADPVNSKLRSATYGRGLWETTVEQGNTDLPVALTTPPTDITETSATVGGNATNEGASSITERGVVWGTSVNPATSDNKIAIGSGTGVYSYPLTGLTTATTYYVRAYAINSQGTSYGANEEFTACIPPEQPGTISGEAAPCEGTTEIYSVTNVSGVTYEWDLPPGWSGSSTTNEITVTVGSSGGTISVTPSNPCGSGAARTFDVTISPTSVAELKKMGINIFPNPANGNFVIEIPNEYSYFKVSIRDVNGKLIFKKSYTKKKNEIDLSKEPAGIYFIQIEIGGKFAITKLILE